MFLADEVGDDEGDGAVEEDEEGDGEERDAEEVCERLEGRCGGREGEAPENGRHAELMISNW